MDQDFNTALALTNLFGYINKIANKINRKNVIQELANMKYALIEVYSTLEFLQQLPQLVVSEIKEKYIKLNNINELEIYELIERRKVLKEQKKYAEADLIRNKLLARGITIKDSREDTEWDIDISFISKNKLDIAEKHNP